MTLNSKGSLAHALLVLCLSPIAAWALWPLPRHLQTGSTALRLASAFAIDVAVPHAPADLLDAVARTKSFLANDKLQRLVVGRGAADAHAIQSADVLRSLTLALEPGAPVRSISDETMVDIESRVEGYTLAVPVGGGGATLTANSTLGLFRGLVTFGQLWYDWDGATYTLEASINIVDSPAYPYRGFMLDTARNFFPVSDIKRTLDAMSWVKINTFHWHITDSQSFPLVIPGFEELADKGAYSANAVYTPKDVQDIVTYAAARGIDVLAEIDTPGHTTAISQSHPEHIACPYATPWSQFASEPPSGQLRVASAATFNFTASLLRAAAQMFPARLYSMAGDEVNTACYAQDGPTQQDLAGRTIEQALEQFVGSLQASLSSMGKRVAIREDMLLIHNVTLSNDTIIWVWMSSENAQAVAQRGYKFVLAPSNYFYLDCGAGEWVGADPSGNSWCDPFKTWQHAYSFDPAANLTAAEHALVLGGQSALWSEQASPANLDSIAWPRAAASAEVFWSGPGGNVSAALPRLHDLAFRMAARGVGAIALQPLWCALRPGVCDLTA